MKETTVYKDKLSRKMFAGSTTIIILFCIILLLSVIQTDFDSIESVSYFKYDLSFAYSVLFYGVLLYGIPVSLISDSLAKSISHTTGKKEIYIAAFLHILAGSLVGLLSLIPAITFFIIDRLLTKLRIYNFPISAIMVPHYV